MIAKGSSNGRLYDVIDEVADNFENLKAKLDTSINPQTEGTQEETKAETKTEETKPEEQKEETQSDTKTEETKSEEQNKNESTTSDDSVDLLAGEHVEEDVGTKVAGKIREANEDEKEKINKLVAKIIEDEKEAKHDQEAATYLLNQVMKSSTYLMNAVNQGLNENSDVEGVQNHLDSIKKSVKEIEDWINKK